MPLDEGQWIRVRKLTGKQWEQVLREQRPGDRWSGFDRYTLVSFGLAAWSYEQVVSADTIGDLDDDTVDFIALAVLKHTKAWLFTKTPADEEALTKNDSGPSTEA